ncbi:MAG TPA: division/cell wall cluster transcriptional repressor MraZ [Ignavibacteria bacterium]|nr:division/cell wall cluster transcriptional repressor MraZ [Ignavibacteria bacterium]
MFQGHANCTLDNKSRIILPAKFRKNINPEVNKLIITRGMEKSLLVYPNDEWLKLTSVLKNFNSFNPEERSFIRSFLMYAHEVELDSQSRILLTQDLIEYANIKKDIIVLGLLDKMELWDPKTKTKYDNSQEKSYEEIASLVASKVNSVNE